MSEQMKKTIAEFGYYHAPKCERHYVHARRVHPYFCDMLAPEGLTAEICQSALDSMRRALVGYVKRSKVVWDALLDGEVCEILDAIERGEKAQAVEECYDAIAVLLRVVDVLEGRQKLGKPEGGAK